MTCDERRDLLLLYVSDALEADEAAELRMHLQSGCAACAGHLAEAQAVMASLPLGLDAVIPPANLKAKLMRRIDAQSGRSPVKKTTEFAVDSLPIRLFRYLVPAAMAAGLAIILTHFVMNQKLQAARQEAMTAKAAVNDRTMLEYELKEMGKSYDAQTKLVDAQTRILDMLKSPESRIVHLTHTDLQPNAVANLIWDQKQQQWAILTTGMKPAAKGETYELWFITSKGAFAAGVFDVDEHGNGSVAGVVSADIGRIQTAAVTNEKAGGVSAPAGQFQVKGSVE